MQSRDLTFIIIFQYCATSQAKTLHMGIYSNQY